MYNFVFGRGTGMIGVYHLRPLKLVELRWRTVDPKAWKGEVNLGLDGDWRLVSLVMI